MGYQDRPRNPTHESLEFRNETDEEYNVVVCQSKHTGQLFVHLLGDDEEIHGDESTTISPQDYEHADIHADKR